MVKSLRRILILASLISGTSSVLLFSQPYKYIEGKIIDSKSREPVPFATIMLKDNQLGVFANAEGDFKILHNPVFQDDSLIITCIGFKRTSMPFKVLGESVVNKIYLTPALYEIGEVKIKAPKIRPGSVAIITRAIKNIKINYPKEPFSYISYYRDYQKRESNYLNLNEAIVQTLDNGFTSKSITNKYRLLDFRKNTDFPRMSLSPFYDSIEYSDSPNKFIPNFRLGDQYGNELFILMVHDAIRNYNKRSFSFIENFSADFLSNHNFSKPALVYNNDLLLYKIIFNVSSRIVGDSLMVLGAIYIQPEDYSIHKLEYKCYSLIKGKGMKEIYNIVTEYGYENSLDSLMCPKYISFSNLFDVADTSDTTYFRLLRSSWIDFYHSPAKVVLEFNNMIDPSSAMKKENYRVSIGGKNINIISTIVRDNILYINFSKKYIQGYKDSAIVNINNIRDVDGKVYNKRRSIELYQYRELFVQEYNKLLPIKDSCYMEYLPLEQNCVSRFPGKDKYWMNTPENILKNS